ncbi:uncharacterized protein LOC124928009 [Impatiens glandulifera]|uniref:uncharacterized protein LOC124928009 n=1 Tax=Impatiens glandulifera TaxID=253017 RepID=UPI001FB124EC|nr:uncharacterized protein LOC124928009 [Impatiens glandulifera]
MEVECGVVRRSWGEAWSVGLCVGVERGVVRGAWGLSMGLCVGRRMAPNKTIINDFNGRVSWKSTSPSLTKIKERKISSNSKEIRFLVNGKEVCWGMKDYALVTGLNFGRFPLVEEKKVEECSPFVLKYFKGKNDVRLKELEDIFVGCSDKEDSWKMGLIFLIYQATLQGIDKDIKHLRGLYLAKKKTWEKKSICDVAYTLHGFALAFQVWTYELINTFVPKVAEKTLEDDPTSPRIVFYKSFRSYTLLEYPQPSRNAMFEEKLMSLRRRSGKEKTKRKNNDVALDNEKRTTKRKNDDVDNENRTKRKNDEVMNSKRKNDEEMKKSKQDDVDEIKIKMNERKERRERMTNLAKKRKADELAEKREVEKEEEEDEDDDSPSTPQVSRKLNFDHPEEKNDDSLPTPPQSSRKLKEVEVEAEKEVEVEVEAEKNKEAEVEAEKNKEAEVEVEAEKKVEEEKEKNVEVETENEEKVEMEKKVEEIDVIIYIIKRRVALFPKTYPKNFSIADSHLS